MSGVSGYGVVDVEQYNHAKTAEDCKEDNKVYWSIKYSTDGNCSLSYKNTLPVKLWADTTSTYYEKQCISKFV